MVIIKQYNVFFSPVQAGCQRALGMENTAISNQQISASSQLNVDHAATQGRLYFEATSTKAGAWSARTNGVNQWLQIDLGMQQTKVTGVATQGRNGVDEWVTKYKLQYSDDGQNFQSYREGQNTNEVDHLPFEFVYFKE